MMNKSITIIFLSLAVSINTFSQNYFQQEVNYTINVSLNDTTHTLDGFIEIEYINHSPDTLTFVWMHLWPNAYKNTQTAYAKQAIENKDTKFWYAKPEQRGYIDKLDFRVNGANANWQFDSTHMDIAKVLLPRPLLPGEKTIITTPFFVKLPKTFSRLGHEGQSYQITQWYPKPAVYDNAGWHPMPYLDQGEFYSEYGSFDVKITVPKNYVVGATGNLQNEEEKQWLNEKAEATAQLNTMQLKQKKNIASDTITKTLHYKINNVHDFAWFADKTYHVLKGEAVLERSGKKVETWVMFTHVNADYWKDAVTYVNEAVQNYSRWVGGYPYDVCTAVQGALSAGGGMEYPTITIVGAVGNARALETVIVHEVGHNWFYGILGSNERMHPWMDEGINSYYEQRHLIEKYPTDLLIGKEKDKGINRFLGVESFRTDEFMKVLYAFVAGYRADQPLGLPSEEYTSMNYGAVVYGKGAWVMEYLQNYLGTETFDRGMNEYFNRWKFKHPQPEDLQTVLEEVSGKKLDWFFSPMLNTSQNPRYKIASVKKENENEVRVRIKSKDKIAFPVSLGTWNTNERNTLVWMDGFTTDTTIVIAKPEKGNRFCLDCDHSIPTAKRQEYYKGKKFRPKFFAAYDRPEYNELFFTPFVTWNNYDKTMLGMAFYNHTIPNKKFTYELVPQYAFGTKTAVGMGRMGYTFFIPESKLHHIDFSVYGRRFGYQLFPEAMMYNKFQPTLTFEINPKHARKHIYRALVLRSVNVWQETRIYDRAEEQFNKETAYYYVNEAAFFCENRRAINPISWQVHLQQGQEFVKMFAEANFFINYNKKNKGLDIRFFAGSFIWENITNGGLPDPRFRMNFSSGFGMFQKDYTFDEFFLGRGETGGNFLAQQIAPRDGGFKTLMSFGQTNRWLSSLNVTTNIPGPIPVKPFIGIGTYGDENSGFNFAFEMGISVVLMKNVAAIHFPLLSFIQADIGLGKETRQWNIGMKRDDADNLNRGAKYKNLITFELNLQNLNPYKTMKRMEFF